MRPKPHIWLVVILLLVVLVVFIVPSVDLEPTALRAIKAAAIIFMGIVIAARTIIKLPLFFNVDKEQVNTISQTPLDTDLQQANDLMCLHCPLLC